MRSQERVEAMQWLTCSGLAGWAVLKMPGLFVACPSSVEIAGLHESGWDLTRIIHEKCTIKAKPLISFATMRMGCLMKFFAMKSLAQLFGGLGRFRAVR